MNFYKIIIILALIVLICMLAFVGYQLELTSQNYYFPPHLSNCPDFYTNQDGTCVPTYVITKNDVASCTSNRFDEEKYNNPGMGPSSGICEKKKWAQTCGVNWDGITNNPAVCYQINE